MFLPLGTDRPLTRTTLVTYVLIGLNVAVFAAQTIFDHASHDRYAALMEQLQVGGEHFHPWSLLTSAFLHGGFMHLAGNMVFLWVFGANIEDRLGRLWFTLFYLGGAAASGGLHALFDPAPAIGASGAIAALTGAYLAMFPRTHVKVLWLLLFFGVYNIPAWWFIGASILWDVFRQGIGGFDGVAHLAHLGGYIYGFLIGMVLLGFRILPREPYDLFTIGRQAYRRRQLKEAGLQTERARRKHWSAAQRRASEKDAGAGAADAVHGRSIAHARAEIATLLASNSMNEAGAAYKRMIDAFAGSSGGRQSTILSRRHQYDLANHFFAAEDHEAAVYAYECFLENYPNDAEAPQIKLLLGRINSRYLNDPVRAKALLNDALGSLRDPAAKDMARKELEALG